MGAFTFPCADKDGVMDHDAIPPEETTRIRTGDEGFLGMLALLTIGHLLTTFIRRRGRDLAIVRTIGFTRGQVRATVAWQAAAITAVAHITGVPAGAVYGRIARLIFAHQLGILPVIDVPLPALVLVVAGAFALALAVAAPLSQAAARNRPARVLRSE
jgi:putative ABC transport system permease protein